MILEPAEIIEQTWMYEVCLTCDWEGDVVSGGDFVALEAECAYYHHCTGEKNLKRNFFIEYKAACYVCSWDIPDTSFSEKEMQGFVNRHNATHLKS